MTSSVSSLVETGSNYIGANPYDFSCYMDQVRPRFCREVQTR